MPPHAKAVVARTVDQELGEMDLSGLHGPSISNPRSGPQAAGQARPRVQSPVGRRRDASSLSHARCHPHRSATTAMAAKQRPSQGSRARTGGDLQQMPPGAARTDTGLIACGQGRAPLHCRLPEWGAVEGAAAPVAQPARRRDRRAAIVSRHRPGTGSIRVRCAGWPAEVPARCADLRSAGSARVIRPAGTDSRSQSTGGPSIGTETGSVACATGRTASRATSVDRVFVRR